MTLTYQPTLGTSQHAAPRPSWRAAPAPAQKPVQRGRLVRLLVVDDDVAVIEYLGRLLKEFAQISFATNGEDALRLAEQHRPDLVLLDVEMPGLGGFEVCQRLRATPGLADLPIIFATSHADAATEAHALKLGANDFLRKPFDDVQVLARLRTRERDRVQALARRKQEAAAARRTTTDMLSYIAHEIGNPVNVIKGFAQLMQAERMSASQADKLAHILEAVGNLSGLLTDLSEFARMAAGQFPIELRDVDLRGLARQACSQIDSQAGDAGLELTPPPPAAPVFVKADVRRLRQCLDNLLSNAIKYGNDGGSIEVELEARGEHIVVAVQDHGAGLSEAQQAHLFEPYNRLGRDTGSIPGTGLGLALTRDLVHAMGGRLEVRSSPGRGCRFEILLQRGGPAACKP
jgi:signal transduction histidine kinase